MGRNLDLIWFLAKRDLSARYKNTFLGFLWTLANPLVFGLTYFYVFKFIFKVQTPNYLLFILAGMFPWTWLQTNLAQSTSSVIDNAGLVKKVKFDRGILPIVTLTQNLINFLLSMIVYIILMFFYAKHPMVDWIIYFPLMLIVQSAMILGISYILSSLTVYFRDLTYIVPLVLNILFYFTPVTYDLSSVPESIRFLAYVNPLSGLIQSWRRLLMGQNFYVSLLLEPALIALILIVLGYLLFRMLQKNYAEML